MDFLFTSPIVSLSLQAICFFMICYTFSSESTDSLDKLSISSIIDSMSLLSSASIFLLKCCVNYLWIPTAEDGDVTLLGSGLSTYLAGVDP
jgi:hypothetical protein